MKILVWQWGRRGAGPRFAACLAGALRGRPGIEVTLSLCRDAEILAGAKPPRCEMPVRTYTGKASFLLRMARAARVAVPAPQAVPDEARPRDLRHVWTARSPDGDRAAVARDPTGDRGARCGFPPRRRISGADAAAASGLPDRRRPRGALRSMSGRACGSSRWRGTKDAS